MSVLRPLCVAALLVLGLAVPAAPAAASGVAASTLDVLSEITDQALAEAAADTAAQGVTTYAVVLDRATGRTLARTANAATPVASESLVKLLIAAWYLVQAEGAPSAELSGQLRTMIAESDDEIASSLFVEGQVTQMAQRYGLTGTTEPADGRWGSTAVTAADLATFLWSSSRDPIVGPWLLDAMAATTPVAADGWDQVFGVRALSGVVGSKQGWGSDNWHSGQPNAVHSVGLTDDLVVVDLQTGVEGTYQSMPGIGTAAVAAVVSASTMPDRFQGALDAVSTGAGLIRVAGWVVDTDTVGAAAPIRITATRATGGELYPPVIGSGSASRPRSDVLTSTGIAGDHGFVYDLGVAEPGRYEVCVTVRSASGPLTIALVDCTTAVVTERAVDAVAEGLPTTP